MPIDDSIITEVFSQLRAEHRCSSDDVLLDPALRERYLGLTRERMGELPERELLHRLIYLRKRGRLPLG